MFAAGWAAIFCSCVWWRRGGICFGSMEAISSHSSQCRGRILAIWPFDVWIQKWFRFTLSSRRNLAYPVLSSRNSCCSRGGAEVTLILHPDNSLLVECPDRQHEELAAVAKQLNPGLRGAQPAISRGPPGDHKTLSFCIRSRTENTFFIFIPLKSRASFWDQVAHCDWSNTLILIVRYIGVL